MLCQYKFEYADSFLGIKYHELNVELCHFFEKKRKLSGQTVHIYCITNTGEIKDPWQYGMIR